MRAGRALAALLALALAAGCIAAPDADEPATPALAAPWDPIVTKHDHMDPAEHAFALNATQVAWLPFAAAGERSGAHALDLHGSLLAVALNGDVRGVALVDVTDPRAPVVVGTVEDASLDGDDRTLAFSEDGETIFLGTSAGIVAIDVADPTRPAIAAVLESPPFGAHTLYAHAFEGKQFVEIVGGGVIFVEYDAAARAFTFAGRYVAATPGQLLASPDLLTPGDGTTYAVRDVYGHDVFVETDPHLGTPVAYVAYAYEGLKIVDVRDPRAPVELGTWVPGGEEAPWYVHTIEVTHRGDRRIAVVGSEVFENRHVDVPSPVWIVDVTDFASPRLLATWVNPGGHGSDNLLLSAHDLRVEGDDLYLAHYHAGVWVLDLAKLEAGDVNATKAYFLPHEDNGWRAEDPCCFGFNMVGNPLVFDVVAIGGHVYSADYHNGLYVHRVG